MSTTIKLDEDKKRKKVDMTIFRGMTGSLLLAMSYKYT